MPANNCERKEEEQTEGTEVALIINNPLLRRGCSAFVLGLVREPGSPAERAGHTIDSNLNLHDAQEHQRPG